MNRLTVIFVVGVAVALLMSVIRYANWQNSRAQLSQLADIHPGRVGSFPANLTVFNDELYFTASDGTTGSGLWKYDGTRVTRVANFYPGSNGTTPDGLTVG